MRVPIIAVVRLSLGACSSSPKARAIAGMDASISEAGFQTKGDAGSGMASVDAGAAPQVPYVGPSTDAVTVLPSTVSRVAGRRSPGRGERLGWLARTRSRALQIVVAAVLNGCGG